MMFTQQDLERWLASLSTGAPLRIGAETLSLEARPADGGALLSAALYPDHSPAQLERALRLGFDSALHFCAGLGLSANGRDLLLCRWLPQVDHWLAAAPAIEELLNQLADWRATLAETEAEAAARASHAVHAIPAHRRLEQRLRMALPGVST